MEGPSMRKKDKDKTGGKAVQAINFDKEVLKAIEEKARNEGTTASFLVNAVCREIFLGPKWYQFKAKYHYMKFQEYKYMQEVKEIER